MQPMLHHVSFGTANMERAARFYDAVLGALGYVRVWEDLRPGEAGQAVGYGLTGGGDKFAIKPHPPVVPPPGPGFHLAFAAASPEAVRAFHTAPFTPRRSRTAATTMGSPARGRSTGPTTTRPS